MRTKKEKKLDARNLNILVPLERIENRILLLRGIKVMRDKDIAYLYEVKPIALRQQVKRNIERFPEDFMFQLTEQEVEILVSQNVIPSIKSLGGSLPYAFTEQGIAMLSGVLTSKRAVVVNIQVMRAFTKLRKMMLNHKEIKDKIEYMEKKFKDHDNNFEIVFRAIKAILEQPRNPKKRIGFHTD